MQKLLLLRLPPSSHHNVHSVYKLDPEVRDREQYNLLWYLRSVGDRLLIALVALALLVRLIEVLPKSFSLKMLQNPLNLIGLGRAGRSVRVGILNLVPRVDTGIAYRAVINNVRPRP